MIPVYAAKIYIPQPGEAISWTERLRADLPEYVMLQVREACHRQRCTIMGLYLPMMDAQRDAHGRKLFYIRDEELVPDRRKVRRL